VNRALIVVVMVNHLVQMAVGNKMALLLSGKSTHEFVKLYAVSQSGTLQPGTSIRKPVQIGDLLQPSIAFTVVFDLCGQLQFRGF